MKPTTETRFLTRSPAYEYAPPAASPWIESDKIHDYPELHSTPTDTVKLLARVEGMDEPQFARYVGACEEWFVFGSPSQWNVTHFAIIYPPNQ